MTCTPAINGLYVSLLAPFIYFFFGTSNHASMGSFSIVALMTGLTNQYIQEKYGIGMGNDTNNPTEFDEANAWKAHVTPIQITTALTFTIGCVHFACGIFRLKFISTYLSDALIKGLTTGAAVHVMVSQIDDILGIEIGRISGIGMILFKMIEIVKKISFVNYVTLGASVITYGFLYVGETYINPLMEKLFKKKIPIPYEMIVMLAFTVVSSIVGFEDKFKVEVVGEVPSGIPVPEVPVFQIVPDLITNAVSIAMVIMALHLSMTKMLADMLKYEVDAGQELYAISFTSVLSSFFPVYPNSIALGRTFVLVNSGGKTMMTNLFSSILMLLVIFFIGPLLYSLPMCILSSIIAFALRPMFRNLLLLPDIYKVSKYDASIFGVAFLGTLATDIVTGFLMSVGFALFTVVLRTQRPSWSLLFPVSTIRQNDSSLLFAVHRFEGPLIFTNGDQFKTSCNESIKELTGRIAISAAKDTSRLLLIIDFARIYCIDSVGIKSLGEAVTQAKRLDVQVAITNINDTILMTLENELFFTKHGIPVYSNLQIALASLQTWDNNEFSVKL